MIGSLYQTKDRKDFVCTLFAPGGREAILDIGSVYGLGYGSSPDDAVWAAHRSMWKGL